MLFNSIDFAIFLPIVFLLYWFVLNRHLKGQNILLVVASYFFYGWWDWQFLLLIFFSTVVDYFVGRFLQTQQTQLHRKLLLLTSIFVNLGFLGFFKYYNFFLDNFVEAFSWFGMPISTRALSIVLPVGISFYTFQTLSYSIDVYRRKIEPTRDFVAFMAFVSFFPQLVAGPIERASNLLPQFKKPRLFNFEDAQQGFYLIVWGLFKKVVIADTCAQYVNDIFGNYQDYSSSTLFLGAIYFAFQIYGDFSGYSDIAIGVARLFGFRLMRNFSLPYFSRDIAEFWRRWHISLSTWFRDYLYIPLGGSRGSQLQQVRNVLLVFLVSGFWHGANWTFIVWGLLNALYFMPLLLRNRNRKHLESIPVTKDILDYKTLFSIVGTFFLTLLAWVFFRASSVKEAIHYLSGMFTLHWQLDHLQIERYSFEVLPLIGILVVLEWFSRHYEHPMVKARFPIVKALGIILMIFVFGSFSKMSEFIYFQF